MEEIAKWLAEFIKWIDDPKVLIFVAGLLVGGILKIYKQVPDWLIPAVLTVLGFVCGFIILDGATFQLKFQSGIMGMVLMLASVGLHQVPNQILNRFKKDAPPEVK